MIEKYNLENFRLIHRADNTASNFGYNKIDSTKHIKGFQIYSTEGLRGAFGPIKSEFYRIGFTLQGSVEVELGLEKFLHKHGTINFTYPSQIFSKYNLSDDFFGYYLLFDSDFLNDLIPSSKIAIEFPFLSYAGIPFFQLNEEELNSIKNLFFKINDELHLEKPAKEKAISLYLYLILLESKRSYERQKLDSLHLETETHLITRFRKLVSEHFLEKRQVSEYAKLLSITPNHLNRVVKSALNRTASSIITEMLLLEAKALLKHTELPISRIAFQLDFKEATSFNRFFKKETGITPAKFRENE